MTTYRGKYPHRIREISYSRSAGWHYMLNNGTRGAFTSADECRAIVRAYPVHGIVCGMDIDAIIDAIWEELPESAAAELAAKVEPVAAEPVESPLVPTEREAASMEASAIDIGMTWTGAAQIIALALENGTGEGKRMAREELARMAALLDSYVAAKGSATA